MEVEDDVFFADLSKQIALLIIDDGNGDEKKLFLRLCRHRLHYYPPVINPVNPAALQGNFVPAAAAAQPAATSDAGAYRVVGERQVKGTGVFIPRSSSNTSSRRMKMAAIQSSRYH